MDMGMDGRTPMTFGRAALEDASRMKNKCEKRKKISLVIGWFFILLFLPVRNCRCQFQIDGLIFCID